MRLAGQRAPTALYNEFDPKAAEWLGRLVEAGHVAPGRVDARSICDLMAGDLDGYTQFHAFAGIGVWSHALRQAGWPDDVPVFTGSCPCQPFSTAGRKKGFLDERHLWPEFFRLIREQRPAVVFGEQVEGPPGRAWLDAVFNDLEGANYACGAAVLPACGVGAPHMRHRLYWVALADGERLNRVRVQLRKRRSLEALPEARGGSSFGGLANPSVFVCGSGRSSRENGEWAVQPDRCSATVRLAHAARDDEWRLRQGRASNARVAIEQPVGGHRAALRLGDASSARSGGDSGAVPGAQSEGKGEWGSTRRLPRELVPPGATRGFWAGAEWLYCRDGKYRPAKPGAFPLAHGSSGRVVRLRGYGNAIVAPVATTFIQSVMDIIVGDDRG